ncbi:uncharacterized protein LOC144750163 [Ciona intestinalis]
MRKMLNGLETSLKDLTALVKRTDDRLDDLEQYGRRNCPNVHGSRRVPGDIEIVSYIMYRREGQSFFWIPERLDLSNGTIYVTHNNKPQVIHNINDIAKLNFS